MSKNEQITTVQMKTVTAHLYTPDILNYLLGQTLSSDELFSKTQVPSLKPG